MFGNKKTKETVSFEKVDTLIGADTSFEGNINASGTIRIDGKFQGEINCSGDLVVGEGGKVKGNLNVRNLLLSGELEGNVKAQNKTEITVSGKILGDITTTNLVIDEGAIFKGNCQMQKQGEQVNKYNQPKDKEKNNQANNDSIKSAV